MTDEIRGLCFGSVSSVAVVPLHDLGRTIVLSGVFDTFGYTYLFYLNDAYVCAVLQACGSADTLESALALMRSCERLLARQSRAGARL